MMLKDDEKIDWVSVHGPGEVTEQIEYLEKKILEITSVPKDRLEQEKYVEPKILGRLNKMIDNIFSKIKGNDKERKN